MISLFRSTLLLSSLVFSTAALADEAKCACGKSAAECKQTGCTCESGTCAVHGGHRAGPMAGMMMPTFDPKTVTTVQGTIVAIDRVEHHAGMVGVHLRVKVGAETLVVHAGPASFIDSKMQFVVNDVVSATGSRISHQGEATLLATTITRGGKTVEIRAADGKPLFDVGMAK